MMKHEWDWYTAELQNLTTELPQYEQQGWTVFQVMPVGDISNRFYTVILKRPIRRKKARRSANPR